MADKKITELEELITPANEDLIPIVDDPSGSPETKKMRRGNFTLEPFTTASDGATVTFDLSVSRNQIVTLGGNRTLALSNVSVGMVFILTLKQDGTGSRTVTWFSGISWVGGSAPTLTTTASKSDTFAFICTGADTYYGYIVGQTI